MSAKTDARISVPDTPEIPCVLEVNGRELAIQVQRMEVACLRVTATATGPFGRASEIVDLRDGQHAPQRAVIEICDIAWRVVDLAGIERAKLAPGELIYSLARAARPARAAYALVHALAWAAIAVADLAGIREAHAQGERACWVGRANPGPRCCLADGHEGPHVYKCSGPSCPGLMWPASERAHPWECAKPVGGETCRLAAPDGCRWVGRYGCER